MEPTKICMGFLLQNVYMKAQTAKERQQRGGKTERRRGRSLGDLEWHSECDCECDWVLGSAKTFSRSVLVSPMPTTTTTTPSERDK